VVKTAIGVYNWSVAGIEDGFDGLLDESMVSELTTASVRGLLPRGGTILGTTNRGRFNVCDVGGEVIKDQEAFNQAAINFKQFGLDALVVIGGEGSQRIGYELFCMGVPVVGVPKTIDNDLIGTDLTFGFDTALDIATEAIDRLHTTGESHDRVMFVEVMGRHVGWIALEAGIAGGADVILIPEIPFHLQKVAAKVAEREAKGRRFSIVVVAEGAKPAGGQEVYQEQGGARRLGGIAERVAVDVERLTGKECRVVVLGHLQRGGTPTAFDRMLASCYGSAAVHAIDNGLFGSMVAWSSNQLFTVPLSDCVTGIKLITAEHHLVRVARDLSISFAGELD
jgi:6-phosphofructokinase 1